MPVEPPEVDPKLGPDTSGLTVLTVAVTSGGLPRPKLAEDVPSLVMVTMLFLALRGVMPISSEAILLGSA